MKRLFIIVGICLLLSACGWGQKVTPLSSRSGVDYTVNYTITASVSQNGEKAQEDVRLMLGMDFCQKESKDDDCHLFAVTVRSLQMKCGEWEYDSSLPAPEPSVWDVWRNAEFAFSTDPEGQVLFLDGWEEMEQNPARGQDETADALLDLLLSKTDFQYYLYTLTGAYPAEGVRPGDSWETSYELAIPVPLQVTTTYTYKEWKDKTASVTADSQVQAPESYTVALPFWQGELQDIRATVSGKRLLQEPNGLAQSGTIDQTVTAIVQQQPIQLSVRSAFVVNRTGVAPTQKAKEL